MTPYQISWQKKRTRDSILAAVLLHLLLIGGMLLFGLLFRENLEEFSGPVLVKLGEPEGADLPLPPEPVDQESIPEETQPEPLDTPEEAPVPEETSIPEEVPRTLPETQNAAEQQTPVDSAETAPVQPVSPPQTVEAPAAPEPVKIQGSDAGNAYETVLATDEGRVGRNLWIPISLYMPLPVNIESSVIDNIRGDSLNTPEDYKRLLLRYYTEDPVRDGVYLLESNVSLPERPTIWNLLENQTDYDVSQAEYKTGRTLNPVVLTFTVNPETNRLEDVELDRTSGYGEIDEAVLYGFQASQYYNSTDRKIKGRFTYRFN